MRVMKLPTSLIDRHMLKASAYLTRDSMLPLEQFCEMLRNILRLSAFTNDGENDYQWGFVHLEDGNVEINISCIHVPQLSGHFSYTISLLLAVTAPSDLDEIWLKQSMLPFVENGLELLRETEL